MAEGITTAAVVPAAGISGALMVYYLQKEGTDAVVPDNTCLD